LHPARRQASETLSPVTSHSAALLNLHMPFRVCCRARQRLQHNRLHVRRRGRTQRCEVPQHDCAAKRHFFTDLTHPALRHVTGALRSTQLYSSGLLYGTPDLKELFSRSHEIALDRTGSRWIALDRAGSRWIAQPTARTPRVAPPTDPHQSAAAQRHVRAAQQQSHTYRLPCNNSSPDNGRTHCHYQFRARRARSATRLRPTCAQTGCGAARSTAPRRPVPASTCRSAQAHGQAAHSASRWGWCAPSSPAGGVKTKTKPWHLAERCKRAASRARGSALVPPQLWSRV
jgi:hypothetical protein